MIGSGSIEFYDGRIANGFQYVVVFQFLLLRALKVAHTMFADKFRSRTNFLELTSGEQDTLCQKFLSYPATFWRPMIGV